MIATFALGAPLVLGVGVASAQSHTHTTHCRAMTPAAHRAFHLAGHTSLASYGTVRSIVRNYDGSPLVIVLSDGLRIHVPPAIAPAVALHVRIGDPVTVSTGPVMGANPGSGRVVSTVTFADGLRVRITGAR